ncbi:superinfection immunity protein [Burkholderia ubonensis]|uniref:superinfection immunity protein n=1 Tax=Burkholderia ubonensis TaxID=101571 RepID=UPI0012FCC444|nr:superinfection immunity protein [Burkholderia ubonensis]
MEYASAFRVPQEAFKATPVRDHRRRTRLVLMVVLTAGYLLPTAIALWRNRMSPFDRMMLFLMNLCGGWTVIGWFVTLHFALKDEDGPYQAQASRCAGHAARMNPAGRASSPATPAVRSGRHSAPADRPGEPLPMSSTTLSRGADFFREDGFLQAPDSPSSGRVPSRVARGLMMERTHFVRARRRLVNVKGGWLRLRYRRVCEHAAPGARALANRHAWRSALESDGRWTSTGLSRIERFAQM